MAFHVGQKVVCVNDTPRDRRAVGVRKGEIYTIKRCLMLYGVRGVELLELDPGPDPGWLASRFRPLIERKSSTSTGFEILDDIRKRESVEEFEKRTKKVRA